MKSKIILSAFSGLFFAIMSFIILKDIYFSSMSAILFAFGLLTYLIINEKIIEKRFRKYEQQIVSTVLFKTNGNFDTGKDVRNANIYICDDCLVFITVDKKPYGITKIYQNQIIRCDCEIDKYKLILMLNDELIYVVQSPMQEEFITQLKINGWI